MTHWRVGVLLKHLGTVLREQVRSVAMTHDSRYSRDQKEPCRRVDGLFITGFFIRQ